MFNSRHPFRPFDNDMLAKYAPSVFTEDKHESRGAGYKVISTISVVEALRNEGFFPIAACESRTRLDDRKGYVKHMLRFRQADNKMTQLGDCIAEIVMTNAHDGTASYQLSAGVYRLACLNGMVVADGTIGAVRILHSGNVIDNVIEGTCHIIEEAPKALEKIEQFRSISLDHEEQLVFAEVAKVIRWDAKAVTVDNERFIRPQRYADKGQDLWTTFNKCQEYIIKGGIQVMNNETKNSQRARAVRSISDSVKMNKEIWQLTEAMADLKTA